MAADSHIKKLTVNLLQYSSAALTVIISLSIVEPPKTGT